MRSDPIRVLHLRSVRGTGGGPEPLILNSARHSDPRHLAVSACYLRGRRDPTFDVDRRAGDLGIPYFEVREGHSIDPTVWRRLRRLVRDQRAEIIHAHDYKADLLALLLARVEPVVPLATAHGWTGATRRERFLYYPVDRLLLRRFPRVIAVSEQIRTVLLRHGAEAERVVVVRNGIDAQRMRRDRSREAGVRAALGLGATDFVIGAVGRLAPQKRFDLLLRAVATLLPSRPNLRLIVAGEGDQRRSLESQARALGLGEVCRLLGQRRDVATLQHAFDLFVQSSTYEGTSIALLEAMALETPIVATNAGGTGDIIESGVHGLLVPPGDAEALARAIDLAAASPSDRAQRAAAARHRVERELSHEVWLQSMERIYRDLLRADDV